MDTSAFLHYILPSKGVYYVVWIKDEGATIHFPFSRPEDAAAKALQLSVQGNNAYHACASYAQESYVDSNGKTRWRTADNAALVKSQWVDIDCNADYTQKQAIEDTARFCKETGLPPPNLVVNSGNGIHCYWVFDRDIKKDTWVKMAELFKAICAHFKYAHTDTTRTADVASVLRPIGTVNDKQHKGLGIKPVKLVGIPVETPINAGEWITNLRELKSKYDIRLAAPKKAEPSGQTSNPNAALLGGMEYPESSAVKIADKCKQIASFRDTGAPHEPEWRASIGVVKHTTEGDVLCHQWSEKYSGYRHTVTQAKLDNWTTGPTTCTHFDGLTGCMADCPHAGKITSPIQLGYAKDDSGPETVELQRLAKLTAVEYDRERKDSAEKMGVRVSTLDDLVAEIQSATHAGEDDKAILFPADDPWPEPVDGAALLTELQTTCARHVVVRSVHDFVAIALWIVLTYLAHAAHILPILNITSPEKRCGKTTLLSVLTRLVFKALATSNITSAALFRIVEQEMPTMLIDEADSFLRPENEELRGIVNSGHGKESAFVIRTVGDDHTPTKFSTFCPKVIAGIGKRAETIEDRSISIELRRKCRNEQVTKLRHVPPENFAVLRQKLTRWAADNAAAFRSARPPIPDEINDRAADNWEPLLMIAQLVGGDWPEKARHAALHLSGVEQDAVSINVELLADIKAVFEHAGKDKLPTRELIVALCADTERPWAAWNRGKEISPHQIAKKLREFDVVARTIRMPDGKTPKGYRLEDFNDAFVRYIP